MGDRSGVSGGEHVLAVSGLEQTTPTGGAEAQMRVGWGGGGGTSCGMKVTMHVLKDEVLQRPDGGTEMLGWSGAQAGRLRGWVMSHWSRHQSLSSRPGSCADTRAGRSRLESWNC